MKTSIHLPHFTSLHEAGAEAIIALVEAAEQLKATPRLDRPLAGQSVALCFMNPSLRTQTSFEVAAASLGAHAVTLSPGINSWKLEARDGAVMDADCPEHVREAVPVLARYCQAIGLRAFPAGKDWAEDRLDPYLNAFKTHSGVPVISLESALGHPCQALADLQTIRSRMDPKGKNFLLTWAPHIKPLPQAVPHSAVEMAAMAGMNITIARPEGYDLDPEVMQRVQESCKANGASLNITSDVRTAYKGQHIVYAKSWGSLSKYGEAPSTDQGFRDLWRVSAAKMAQSADAAFLHCLPVRRNIEVDDAVLDGPSCVVIDQAENRLHTAKAVLLNLMEKRS